MRRLAQHAIAGIGFSALIVTAGVAGLGSPAGEGSAIAVPAPVTSVAVEPVSEAGTAGTELNSDRASRDQRITRAAQRAQLAAAKQAAKRAATLGKQGQSIETQQAKLKAEKAADAKAEAEAKAKAAAEAAAAKEAQARVLANRGYEPGTTDPREIARQILKNKYGYGASQFTCFNNIIMRESMWKVNATNPSSGAYGIPQALPGSKMATIASDWRTNPATQIIWGIEYMKKRYGSPCEAWSFKHSHGWY